MQIALAFLDFAVVINKTPFAIVSTASQCFLFFRFFNSLFF